jgi:outer membrane autotransporter protein
MRLSQYWAAEFSMTYGLYDSDLEVGALSGSYDTRILGGKAKLYGQYQVGEYFLRPEAAISYARIESDGFDLSGNIIGREVTIDFVENNFNAGLVEASTEFSRQIDFGDGKVFIPFTEIGVQYAFDRPNDGKILTGNFSQAQP